MTAGKGSRPPCEKLAFYLLKGVNKAVRDHSLVADGDRVAVAVSGGKDSLSLLRLLGVRRESVPETYELASVHVTPAVDAPCAEQVDTGVMERWHEREGVPLSIVPMEEAGAPPDRDGVSPCFHCAWRRRKALFRAAEELGCNKVAFGHHADDVAQTTLLNLFFHGRLETMQPLREFFEGRLTVIRPLVYVDEKELARFAVACEFPPAPSPCEQATASRRALMAEVLRTVERAYPKSKINLWRAVQAGEGAD